MDKIEASVLGIGIFAATQFINNVKNQDSRNNMRSIMRSEAADIENLSSMAQNQTEANSKMDMGNMSTQTGMNQTSSGKNENIVPGIALNEFVSNRYKISFKYPRSWKMNPRYEEKYEGTSGFFEVGDFAGQGENIDEAVNAQIHEAYQPYGSNPIVRRFTVDGQPARVIYPSADQPDFYKDRDAAIVVQYPNPVTVEGKPYDYVVIWTTREYVPLIMSTLKFIK